MDGLGIIVTSIGGIVGSTVGVTVGLTVGETEGVGVAFSVTVGVGPLSGPLTTLSVVGLGYGTTGEIEGVTVDLPKNNVSNVIKKIFISLLDRLWRSLYTYGVSFGKKILLAWWPTILWMGLIYYLSSYHAISASVVTWQDFTVKKSAHIIIYFILAVWMYRSLKFSTSISAAKLIFWTIVLVGLYAITDEIHQSFVPTRGPNIRDVAIDILGASTGAVWSAKIIYKKFT